MRILLLLFLLIPYSWAQTASIYGTGSMQGKGVWGQHLIDETPPMGWNSWYYNFQNVYPGAWQPTETYIKAQSDAMVSSGLAGLGYKYMGIDAGWQAASRSGGLLVPNAAQFPSGMASLATYVHSKGLLLGVYSTPSTPCAAGYPSSGGFETADAATFAGWGVDLLKYDGCGLSGTNAAVQAAYQAMGTGLWASGRRISYLVNQYSDHNSIAWFSTVGGTHARIGTDNGDGLWYVKAQTEPWTTYALSQSKGYWLDPDYLMGGLTEGAQAGGPFAVSDTEARAQFNWYAIGAFPLVIATRIDLLDASLLTTYGNSEVIAVDQDSLGIMGTLRDTTTCGATVCHVWTRLLANGDYAICLINYDPSNAHTVAVLWSDFGQSGTFNIRDLWTHSSVGSSSTGYSVSLPAWGSTMLRISR